MAKRGTRKKKRFGATSLPVLSPKTLKEARPKQRRGRETTRKRKKKDSRLGKLVRSWGFSHYIALLLMITGVVALGFLFTDATFQSQTPEISGNSYLDAESILQQADLNGQNIYIIDPQRVARQLTTFLPQIKEARVRLALPNQIAISVVERQPVLVYARGNQTLWADEEGRLFPAISERSDLPVLIDEDGSASADGKHLNPGVWQAIQTITTNIPEMKEFHHRQVYGLFFISPEGWRVYLGDGDRMKAKLATWQAMRQQLLQENRPIKTVDLRYDRVYVQ
jgi:cell division septal protein FtsQ